ncbi:ATP-binding protein [Streptomyces sp. NPDC006923]|uniref:SCO6881 family protein n=1 Tax=Streptomyces sp. NPDC006923 TaxID=3155355 RepID=UPI0033CA1448
MDFCDLPLAGHVCGAADAVDFVTDPGQAIGNWIAKSTGELAAVAADFAAKAVNSTTRVDLNAAWFRDNYELILPVGLVLLVATFCAQLIRAAVRRDGQALTQAFTGTASGVLFSFAAIALTTVALEVVDALSDGLFRAANSSVEDAVRRIIKVSEIAGLSGLGWMVPTITALGAALGALLYWGVMMVRKVGILVLVTLAVFAGAGGGWEAARRWRKGWIEATATLVVSKLLMTIVFLLGISAMGRSDARGGLTALADVMAGIIIMIMVLFCPYATFKFVHWAAEGSDGENLHRAGGAGAQLAKQHAERVGRKAASMAATAGTGGAAAGATAAPQGPDRVPGGDGFPGDIAANPTGGSRESGTSLRPGGEVPEDGPKKVVQPAPTSPGRDIGGQLGPAGHGGGFMSPAPSSTSQRPQGAAPAPDSSSRSASGPAAGPPPPTGN